MSRRARFGVVGAGVLAGLVVAGGLLVRDEGRTLPDAKTSKPRPVTAAEADRLAVMRFRLQRAGGVHFRTEVSSARGSLSLVGDVDYSSGIGKAQISGAGSSFTLQWNGATLLAWAGDEGASDPAVRPLEPTQSASDAVLALLLELGQDRPDNAQLIRENGARWLRAETVGGTGVDVLQGPAPPGAAAGPGGPVTYWVNEGGDVLRIEARLGGGPSATIIDLDPGRFVPFAPSTHLPA